MTKEKIKIAIDGPAGAGKSTVAKLVAERLNYIYVDTGAMYRTLTLKALTEQIDLSNKEELAKMAQDTDISFSKEENGVKIKLDGEDVSAKIRQNKVSNNVSKLAQYRAIRSELLKLQQEIAQDGGVVMDGRDIGTVVLADAELKIYLTASVDERAKRRYNELKEKEDIKLTTIKEEIIKRDQMDRNRDLAPLKQAEDAVEVDTTDLGIKEVVDRIIELFQEVIN